MNDNKIIIIIIIITVVVSDMRGSSYGLSKGDPFCLQTAQM
jgi:hypothetical protein